MIFRSIRSSLAGLGLFSVVLMTPFVLEATDPDRVVAISQDLVRAIGEIQRSTHPFSTDVSYSAESLEAKKLWPLVETLERSFQALDREYYGAYDGALLRVFWEEVAKLAQVEDPEVTKDAFIRIFILRSQVAKLGKSRDHWYLGKNDRHFSQGFSRLFKVHAAAHDVPNFSPADLDDKLAFSFQGEWGDELAQWIIEKHLPRLFQRPSTAVVVVLYYYSEFFGKLFILAEGHHLEKFRKKFFLHLMTHIYSEMGFDQLVNTLQRIRIDSRSLRGGDTFFVISSGFHPEDCVELLELTFKRAENDPKKLLRFISLVEDLKAMHDPDEFFDLKASKAELGSRLFLRTLDRFHRKAWGKLPAVVKLGNPTLRSKGLCQLLIEDLLLLAQLKL